MSKLALFVLLAAVAVVSARDKAHITGKFYCSARSQHQWIPSSTHLKFWDKGRIFDNIVKEFNLDDKNQTIDTWISNGIYGLNPYLTITHYCNVNNDQINYVEKLKLGENYLGNYDLARAHN
ncbi:unnamed protein product [Bursaphelenchus xylophilus]|uniref:(pine wood nematode) hypothetical protein n=1 Tax=Bursaphelenchus xylophilus TaxID=6326 RepID=A0A7I8WZC5_BURXY|nr:unnamed protein product [Bursaphelenchus xylophilus]CAG9102327.1 unnamed protein product [Bursaphelenchus xylophilus]